MARYDRTVSLTDQAGNSINVGNPLPTSGGGSGGGGAVTVADGADICQGSTSDLAITGDNPGTLSAKLRGINKILAAVADLVNGWLNVNIRQRSANPKNALVTLSTLSAGAITNADSSQISSGKTGYLSELIVAGSVPFKAELKTVLNGVESGNVVVWISDGDCWDWRPAAQNLVTQAQDPAAGFDGFRVYVTNLDPQLPANMYVTFFWEEL
jgi:hypothetical protein